jgi:hypothetical protein
MSNELNKEAEIIELLSTKSSHKQATYRNTLERFKLLNGVVAEISEQLSKQMKVLDPYVEVSVKTPNLFDCEFKFSGDMLVFSMHSNVFTFEKKHPIFSVDYIKEQPMRGYFGVINVYNFLSDSYKYNRLNDLGYLIARIFVNKDNHFFMEGLKQLAGKYKFEDVDKHLLDESMIRSLVEQLVLASLSFDLYAPPYDQVQVITVSQKITENANSGLSTGKRLGYWKPTDN